MNLSDIFSERLVYALGWTILHSLWQGAAISILLGLLMIAMRSYSSQSRYFASVSALLTITLLAVVTFATYYGQYRSHLPANFTLELPIASPTVATQASTEAPVQTASQVLFADTEIYFRQHLPLLVSVWLLGIAFLLLRFVGGYAYLQRLKSYQTRAVNDYWQGTLAYLAAEIGVKRKVRLLESGLAEMPMVIGWLKPIILLPLGTLSGLSSSQVESILAHELAHLKRNDYAVNMIQSMLEIIFFYNPFIWWVSGYIRQERENCCDDIAVELTGDSLTLVKTLAILEEFRVIKPSLAMGFAGGTRGGLLLRVRRLLTPKRKASGFSEGFLSAMVLVFCFSITTVNAYTPYNWHNFQALADKSWQQIQKAATVLTGNAYTASTIQTEAEILPIKNTQVVVAREKMPNLIPLRRLDINDTIRFGKGYMAITNRIGSVKMFKDGKEIPKEELDKYKEEFALVKTPRKSYQSSHIPPIFPVMPAFPVYPVYPVYPVFPVMPAIPAMPNMQSLHKQRGVYMTPEIWENNVKRKTKRKLRKGESANLIIIDKNEIRVDGNLISLNELENSLPTEQQWEEYGKQWEEYGKEWGQYADHVDNRTEGKIKKKAGKEMMEALEAEREVMEAEREVMEAEREVMEAEREHEQEIREKAHEEEIEKRQEMFDAQIKSIKEAWVRDGLVKADTKSIKIKSNKAGITINGKKLTPEQALKYRPMLSEAIGIPEDGSKEHNWDWNWSE